MIKPQTLKGFRDFLPAEARKRQYVIGTLKSVFELYGFEPLETPVLEYEEILTGKYGDEGDKLMYRFEDNGKRRVAMRYDQTVPLARVVAQYQNEISFPFKRYQISPVWRAENTQKGRYREFLQCDIDTVGIDTPLADAEIIATAATIYQRLGLKNFKILLNDRAALPAYIKTSFDIPIEKISLIFRALDKIKKIGEEGVLKELSDNYKFSQDEAKEILKSAYYIKETENISNIKKAVENFGIDSSLIEFTPTLARGMDYYSGMIFEIESPDYPYGSLGGGGRYNNLIGLFSEKIIPAAGFAVGFDRTLEAMEELNLFPDYLAESATKVLVTIFSDELKQKSVDICSRLRLRDINAEIYLGEIKEKNPLEKQLKYADQKKIPYALIIGPEEVEKNEYKLKNLKTREQSTYNADQLISFLRK